jgi:hypothetical protein
MNFVWGYFWVIISSGAAWYFNFENIVPFLFMGALFQSIYLLSFYKNYRLHKPDVIASILTGTTLQILSFLMFICLGVLTIQIFEQIRYLKSLEKAK